MSEPVYNPRNLSELCASCSCGRDERCTAVDSSHTCLDRIRWTGGKELPDCGHPLADRDRLSHDVLSGGYEIRACAICGRLYE